MSEAVPDVERELNRFETELKQLETEYTMYFAGRLKRPPVETRNRVAALARRLDRVSITNYGVKFRFTTLQTRFAKLSDLWERALRAREEGRPGPFVQAPTDAAPRRPREAVVGVTTFADPAHEADKLQQLYDTVTEARRQTGQRPIPFDRFSDLVAGQVARMKEKGRSEVAFRVKVKNGKVELTARGAGERPEE